MITILITLFCLAFAGTVTCAALAAGRPRSSRITHHVSRFTPHASRFTPHASRFTIRIDRGMIRFQVSSLIPHP